MTEGEKEMSEGMSVLEKKLIEANENLVQEQKERSAAVASRIKELERDNEIFRDLLIKVQEHIIEIDEDKWCCPLCGERAPMEIDTRAFPHATYCVLYKPGE